jgi:uncharacterized protein (TIGR03435 family)
MIGQERVAMKVKALWSISAMCALWNIGGTAVAQVPPRATFDVASIKQNNLEPSSSSPKFTVLPGGYLTIVNTPVREIIRSAYQVQDYELIGGPDWIRRSRYDVEAKAQGMPPLRFPPGLGALTHPVYPMLRAMLEDRFKVVVHHETRSLPMYALVIARPDGKLGPQLHPGTTDCAAVNAARGTDKAVRSSTPDGAPPCGMVGSGGAITRVTADSQATPSSPRSRSNSA